MINDKYKYIIFTYPKSGCSTIRTLHLYLNTEENLHVKSDKFISKHHDVQLDNYFIFKKENIKNKYKDYYKVLIYRNSYERLLSSFYQKFLGISGKKTGVYVKQGCLINQKINSFDNFLKYKLNSLILDNHFAGQKFLLDKDFFDEILNIKDIEDIFKNYKDLNYKSKEIIKKYDINFMNKIDKEINKEYEKLDLFNYDFYKDDLKILKKDKMPNYKYFLTEENKKKIKEYYQDDFYEL